MNNLSILLITLSLFIYSCNNNNNLTTSTVNIVGGKPLTNDNPGSYSSVALSLSGQVFCTGVLVAENLVLTAAHCVDGRTGWPTDIKIHFAENGYQTPQTHLRTASEIQLHKDYYLLPNDDIAWIKFDGGIPSDYKPIKILKDSNHLKPNTELTLVGYGKTQTNLASKGIRLTNKTILRAYLENDRRKGLIIYGPTPNAGTCVGDSGGPAYIMLNGEWYVAGVTSGYDTIIEHSTKCEQGAGIHNFIGYHLNWIVNSSNVVL